jgi:hypothetical protein
VPSRALRGSPDWRIAGRVRSDLSLDYTATAPVLLAEVLSPSNAEIDLEDKVTEYLRIPGLLAYMVFSQDEPKAWVWMRESTGLAPQRPTVFTGSEAVIRLAALNLDLPLAELYSGTASGWTRAADFACRYRLFPLILHMVSEAGRCLGLESQNQFTAVHRPDSAST